LWPSEYQLAFFIPSAATTAANKAITYARARDGEGVVINDSTDDDNHARPTYAATFRMKRRSYPSKFSLAELRKPRCCSQCVLTDATSTRCTSIIITSRPH
jgi:hypothetical protein